MIFVATVYAQSRSPESFSGLGWNICIGWFTISFAFFIRDSLVYCGKDILCRFFLTGQFYFLNCFEDLVFRDLGMLRSVGLNKALFLTFISTSMIEAANFGMIYHGHWKTENIDHKKWRHTTENTEQHLHFVFLANLAFYVPCFLAMIPALKNSVSTKNKMKKD